MKPEVVTYCAGRARVRVQRAWGRRLVVRWT